MESSNNSSSEVVKVVEIEGKGRALVSTKTLRGGSIILRDSPILLYSALPFHSSSSSSSSSSYCFNCFRTLKTLQSQSPSPSCPSCSHVLFCSPNCQSLSLSSSGSHSPWVCQTLRHLQNSPSLLHHNQDLQVQSCFLVAAYNLALVSPSHFQILLSLHGQPSPHEFAAAHILHSLISPPPFPFPFPFPFPSHGGGNANVLFSVELSASLLAKDKLNAFGLMEPPFSSPNAAASDRDDRCISSVRAYGIYPKASLFNHDCLPNACRFDYVDSAPPDINSSNTDLIFRLIHDVPQGREICLSYFPVNQNYSNRQKSLFEDYGFICDCDRCKVEANWSDKDNDDDDDHQVHQVDNDDDDDDDDEAMDEDQDEQMLPAASDGGDHDFPHSYFFLRYVCNRDNCWGTLAPLPPSDADGSLSKFLECNVCGNLKKDDEFGD